jgi:hypothetical protein
MRLLRCPSVGALALLGISSFHILTMEALFGVMLAGFLVIMVAFIVTMIEASQDGSPS